MHMKTVMLDKTEGPVRRMQTKVQPKAELSKRKTLMPEDNKRKNMNNFMKRKLSKKETFKSEVENSGDGSFIKEITYSD